MAWLDKLHHPEQYIKTFFKWGLLGLIMGVLGGLIGAGFHHALHFVTHVRAENTWLIFLLPVGGLLSVAWYRLLKLKRNRGTNEIIDSVLSGEELKPQIAPGIFGAAMLTHLFGGSAGREGAALQLGGSVASVLGKLLKLRDKDRTALLDALGHLASADDTVLLLVFPADTFDPGTAKKPSAFFKACLPALGN